jgi:exodeoxyribonuclease VII large subunit
VDAISHIRLSELTAIIKRSIEEAFHYRSFWVVADVSNHTYKETSNYHYFELVEKAGERGDILAKMSASAWGAGSGKISRFEKITGQRFGSNIRVLVQVQVTYHPRFGLQLSLQDIDPSFTLGAMEAQRQETLRRLVTENPGIVQLIDGNYITQNQQLQIPRVIQRIALVSAAQSAGAEDFRHSLQHNEYGYLFFVDEFHAPVQGEHHAEALLECIVKVFTTGKPYDVVVLTRGGGAQTDFLIFDDYKIGQAIAKFPIPVITGIGHQKNETIADLMAHTALKTPTKAAEYIIAHNKAFEDRILALQKAVVIKSQQLFSKHQQSLSTVKSIVVNQSRNILSEHKDLMASSRQLVLQHTRKILYGHKSDLLELSSVISSKPRVILANRVNDLRNNIDNLRTFQAQFLKNQRGYLNHLQTVIRLMHPANILKKGFALVKVDGRVTSNPDDLQRGKDMDIILSGMQITATVTSKKTYDGNDFDL